MKRDQHVNILDLAGQGVKVCTCPTRGMSDPATIAPICPHPKCREKMLRGYVRQGKVNRSTHWISLACHMVRADLDE